MPISAYHQKVAPPQGGGGTSDSFPSPCPGMKYKHVFNMYTYSSSFQTSASNLN